MKNSGKTEDIDLQFKRQDWVAYFFVNCINILQNITVTAIIRYGFNKFDHPLSKSFYSFWVVFWLFALIILNFINGVPPILVILIVAYRFWEMMIVNLWLFLSYRKIGRHPEPFYYVRLILSLIFQYLTTWFGFAMIYKNLYLINVESFKGIQQGDSIFTWLYFSMATITTLGFGEIHASQHCVWSIVSVISETFMGIFYIVWFLGTTISKLELEWEE